MTPKLHRWRDKTGGRSRPARRGACLSDDLLAVTDAPAAGHGVFNTDRALANVGGDANYLGEVVGLVQAALPALLARLRHALAAGDLRAIRRAAHLLKAAAHSVSADRARAAAILLETAARRGEGNVLQPYAQALEAEVARLAPALAEHEQALDNAEPTGAELVSC